MLIQVYDYLRAKLGAEQGATMAEYGLMIALVAIVVSVGAAFLGVEINGLFDRTGSCVQSGGPC